MNEARRTLRCWLLMAFLERGAGPPARRPAAPPARVRPMSREELRRLCGPLAPIRVLRPEVARRREALPGVVLPFPGGA
ncbi:MAG: hypothetical protein AAF604_19305 [Acidobacteriota bacterium]